MLKIKPGQLTLDDVRDFWINPKAIDLVAECRAHIENGANYVAQCARKSQQVYGVNTGFGKLAHQRIAPEQTTQLQHALIQSHCAGVGDPISTHVVRLALLLKINALAQGYSGVRQVLIDGLINLLNCDAIPYVPVQGSVGASGDLAPLAHVSGVLLGFGQVYYQGVLRPSQSVLTEIGQSPMTLAPKEGLALINGTQISHALALYGLFLTEACWRDGVVLGALSLEGVKGSRQPFDQRLHALRRHKGQICAASCYRHLLGEQTEISQSHQECAKVQDPYSIRCQPQVMGACLQQLWQAQQVLADELNAVTDNPLVFSQEQEILTGGNFHAQPVAMVCDNLALVLAEIGSLSERRIALMMDAGLSGLPAFLVKENGLNSGFMIAQVTAAALVGENKMLCHPASIDSIPTSANQEDHVSMATHGAHRLAKMACNTRAVLAIEWLCAAQALDFHHPLQTSQYLTQAYQLLRTQVTQLTSDRILSPDIEQATDLLEQQVFAHLLPQTLWHTS